MRLLALDTSSIACSVAVQVDGEIIERHAEQPREHTRLLIPMIRSVLDESAVSLNELDAIVLGNGPGSFVGLRIAASVAQGLAFAAGLQIVPVSSLAAVAVQAFNEHNAAEIAVAQDAHMQEVYLGIYSRASQDPVELVCAERLQGQEVIAELESPPDRIRLAAGFGWQRYPELLAKNRRHLDEVLDILYPKARFLLPLGLAGYKAKQAVPPQLVSPVYLRENVAAKPARV